MVWEALIAKSEIYIIAFMFTFALQNPKNNKKKVPQRHLLRVAKRNLQFKSLMGIPIML